MKLNIKLLFDTRSCFVGMGGMKFTQVLYVTFHATSSPHIRVKYCIFYFTVLSDSLLYKLMFLHTKHYVLF